MTSVFVKFYCSTSPADGFWVPLVANGQFCRLGPLTKSCYDTRARRVDHGSSTLQFLGMASEISV